MQDLGQNIPWPNDLVDELDWIRSVTSSLAMMLSQPLACLVLAFCDRRSHARLQSASRLWNAAGHERTSWAFPEHIFNLLYGMHVGTCDWKRAERTLRHRKIECEGQVLKTAQSSQALLAVRLLEHRERCYEVNALLGLVLMERVDWSHEGGVFVFHEALLELRSAVFGYHDLNIAWQALDVHANGINQRMWRLAQVWRGYVSPLRDTVRSLWETLILPQLPSAMDISGRGDALTAFNVDIEVAQERYWHVRLRERLLHLPDRKDQHVLHRELEVKRRHRDAQVIQVPEHASVNNRSALGHLGVAFQNRSWSMSFEPEDVVTWPTYPPACFHVIATSPFFWRVEDERSRKKDVAIPRMQRACKKTLECMLDSDFSAGLLWFERHDASGGSGAIRRASVMHNELSNKVWQHTVEQALWAGSRAGNANCASALTRRLVKQRATDRALKLDAQLSKMIALGHYIVGTAALGEFPFDVPETKAPVQPPRQAQKQQRNDFHLKDVTRSLAPIRIRTEEVDGFSLGGDHSPRSPAGVAAAGALCDCGCAPDS
jgi:hypothetical protein